MKPFGFLLTLVVGALVACAPLQKGADPLIVRAEQAERAALSTFDLVLNIDHANRDFFRTNAPAFHSFCEWLREPDCSDGTNQIPRAICLIRRIDNLRHRYKDQRADSNELATAVSMLQATAAHVSQLYSQTAKPNAP